MRAMRSRRWRGWSAGSRSPQTVASRSYSGVASRSYHTPKSGMIRHVLGSTAVWGAHPYCSPASVRQLKSMDTISKASNGSMTVLSHYCSHPNSGFSRVLLHWGKTQERANAAARQRGAEVGGTVLVAAGRAHSGDPFRLQAPRCALSEAARAPTPRRCAGLS